jgi:hypothetical protein
VCDTVLALQLTGNCTQTEAKAALKPLTPIMEANKIDGFIFVETSDQFRITEG